MNCGSRDDVARAGQRQGWWNTARRGVDGVLTERRQLVILSVLGGLVFFGASSISNRTTAPRVQQVDATGSSETAGEATGFRGGASMLALSADSPNPLKVRLYNAYTMDNPIELYPWEHLAEPHKPSTMEMLDWPAASDELEYR